MIIQIFPARLLALVEPVKFNKRFDKEQIVEIINMFSEEFDYDLERLKDSFLNGYVSSTYVYNRLERVYHRKNPYDIHDTNVKDGFRQYMIDKQAWLDYKIRNELGDTNENQSANTNAE